MSDALCEETSISDYDTTGQSLMTPVCKIGDDGLDSYDEFSGNLAY